MPSRFWQPPGSGDPMPAAVTAWISTAHPQAATLPTD